MLASCDGDRVRLISGALPLAMRVDAAKAVVDCYSARLANVRLDAGSPWAVLLTDKTLTADEWVADICTTTMPDGAQTPELDGAHKLKIEPLSKKNERLKEKNVKLREAATRNDADAALN
jgi:hypothetical protein